MEQFKRAQVIMLPTKHQSCIIKGNTVNKLLFTNVTKNRNYVNNQHLYIISDDEIKKGDWFIDDDCSLPIRAGYNKGLSKTCKKIIATTDTSLRKATGEMYPEWEYLPQPSQQFIEKYIESYNKGKVITDVLVEYEGKTIQTYPRSGRDCGGNEIYEYIETLKINPKDNTITIKKLKDSYSKTEIIELFKKHNIDICKKYHISYIQEFTDKWLDKNL